LEKEATALLKKGKIVRGRPMAMADAAVA
jgi:hypothetical protein